MDFPKAQCPLCSFWDICKNSDKVRPEYPQCQSPLLGSSLSRADQLLHVLSPTRQSPPPLVRKTLLTWLERHRDKYSEIFEPSLSIDEKGVHLFRFSYAFPGFMEESELITGELKRLASEFGDYSVDAISRLEPALSNPIVQQPIVGLSWDSKSSWRFKIYLQFFGDEDEKALRLAQVALGHSGLMEVFTGKSLRLLGMDLGPRGMTGAKLYFHVPDYENALQEILPSDKTHLLNWMAERGHGPPADVLSIHRLSSPSDRNLAQTAEVDFSLPSSDLLLEDLLEHVELGRLMNSPHVKKIWGQFRLAARRISVSVQEGNKINLYYVLAEKEK